jgi:hypothetical protein
MQLASKGENFGLNISVDVPSTLVSLRNTDVGHVIGARWKYLKVVLTNQAELFHLRDLRVGDYQMSETKKGTEVPIRRFCRSSTLYHTGLPFRLKFHIRYTLRYFVQSETMLLRLSNDMI